MVLKDVRAGLPTWDLLLAGACGRVKEFIHPGGVLGGLLFIEKEASAPGCATGSWQNLAGVENVPWQGNLVGGALLGNPPPPAPW